MDRKQYLEMCCECSKLPKGSRNIPSYVPDNLIIKVNEIPFYPFQYILSYENGQIKHIAVLHDLKTNSTVQIELLNI